MLAKIIGYTVWCKEFWIHTSMYSRLEPFHFRFSHTHGSTQISTCNQCKRSGWRIIEQEYLRGDVSVHLQYCVLFLSLAGQAITKKLKPSRKVCQLIAQVVHSVYDRFVCLWYSITEYSYCVSLSEPHTSLVPRPHPLARKNGLVTSGRFLGLH